MGMPGHRAIEAVELLQKRDEIGTALGAAGVHDQLARGPVERAEHRHLLGLPGRWNAQIRAPLGPGLGEIGMGERFGFIAEQKHDIARLGLRLQQLEAQAGAVDGVGILAALQRVPRPAPAETPFLRNTDRLRAGDAHALAALDLVGKARQGPIGPVRDRSRQNRLGDRERRSALTGAGPGATIA